MLQFENYPQAGLFAPKRFHQEFHVVCSVFQGTLRFVGFEGPPSGSQTCVGPQLDDTSIWRGRVPADFDANRRRSVFFRCQDFTKRRRGGRGTWPQKKKKPNTNSLRGSPFGPVQEKTIEWGKFCGWLVAKSASISKRRHG